MSYLYPFKEASEDFIQQVWQKGKIISGYSADEWKYDICGNPIRYSDHGNTNS